MAALDLFTYYNNRSLGGVTDPNSDQAQAALAQVRAYDPTASYRPTFGSDGQLIGYTLDFDASKLPGVGGTGSLGGTSGHGSGADFMPRFSTVQPNMVLTDPSAVTQDVNYGKITDNTNISNPRTPLDYLGPAAVAAFAFGVPYLASAMSGGAIGGFSPGMYALGGNSGDLSGLGASDPYLQGGTGAMDVSGSYGTGLPGSLGSNLGGAESSLYGAGALTDPANALGGAPFNLGDQPLLPMMPQEPVYNQMVPFNPADPSYGQFAINPNGTATAGADLARNLATSTNPFDLARRAVQQAGNLLKPGGAGSGTGSSGTGSGGGGNGLLAMAPRAQQTYGDLTSILRHFYGGGNG